MAAEDRRTLQYDAGHGPQGDVPLPGQDAHPAETFPAQYYAQFNSPDPYALPRVQDLDAVAQAESQPQPSYQDAQYGQPPEPVQPLHDVPIAEPQAAPADQPEQFAPAAEAPARHFAPEREPAIDLHYPPPPSPAVEQSPAHDGIDMPVAVNENRRPEAVPEPQARTGAGGFAWFVAAIAFLALGVAVFQTFVFQRSIAAIESNVARGQFALACRDSIGSYYDARQKISVLMPAADRGNVAGASRVTEYNRLEAQAAIAKLGALTSYLAAFQDAGARVRYAELTRAMNGIMDVARTTPLSDIGRVFAPADKLISGINSDCVRLSQAVRL